LIKAEALSLANGFATRTAALGDLPEEGPEDQAQGPKPPAGVRALLLLGQSPVGDPPAKEAFELMQAGAGAGAETMELLGEAAGPGDEVGRCHRQSLYCPIDIYATLFCMSNNPPREYARLRNRLAKIGWIALGSLVERNKPGQGGPRYQWSWRVDAKTVTVALSLEQFEWLKEAVSNQREVWDVLTQLQHLTVRHVLENLPNPPRRKRLNKKKLGLN
jgi:hypothetical protein